MNKETIRWNHRKLRGLYAAYGNGKTYLCEKGSGQTRGVVHNDGSGSWTNGLRIKGPHGWRSSNSRVINVRVEESNGQWTWIVTRREHDTHRMRGRFSAIRLWVVVVQQQKHGPWIVIPPLPPFALMVHSSAPELPWLDKLMKAVEDVKKTPIVVVQKNIMADFFRPSIHDDGPRWEMLCQYIRLRAATRDGQYVAVRLLAPGGIIAAEECFRGKKRQPITTGIIPALALRGTAAWRPSIMKTVQS